MSQSVEKLKQLLFEPESEAIAALTKRIESVFDRAGTNERFQASVAKVLDGALRDAEVERHDQVASAIAPLIVKTVKAEIHNSTDDLVEALYPATGRMVKAYVASAIQDLTNEINRKLSANPFMLRLNALLTGRSVGELALADSQRLMVEDVFLIRRATGELVARWPKGEGRSNLDHVLGGVLTTINEFTSEAFKAEGSALRQLDLGDARVYLRVSPTYLLAAKCSGTAPAGAEQAFDEEFLNLVDRHDESLNTGATTDAAPLLEELATHLEARLSGLQPGNGSLRRGVRPLTLLAVLIGLPLAGWLAWSIFVDYRLSRTESVARATLNGVAEMNGYPNEIKASERGSVVTITGLAPTDAVKASLIAKMQVALPGVGIHDRISPVPAQSADVRPLLNELKQDQRAFEAKVEEQVAKQNQARASRLSARTARILRNAATLAAPAAKPALSALADEAAALNSALIGDATPQALAALPKRFQVLAAGIRAQSLTGLNEASATQSDEPASEAVSLVDAANTALNASLGYVELSAMKRKMDNEAARMRAAIPVLTPREQLEKYARSNAIFFNENASFRDEAEASRVFDDIVRLMAAEGLFLRVVGYTDDAGTPAKNLTIAKSRAEAVAAALVARGLPPNRLVALNRIAPETNVSPVNGVGSANRRVEFEVGFNGEGGR
ncbi:MAG: OmpA family protein [Hyphomicrobiaceae bacterium]